MLPRRYFYVEGEESHKMQVRLNSINLRAIALILPFVLISTGFGQNTNSGEIRGTVKDPSGAPSRG